MQRIRVRSSAITSIGYSRKRRVLEIEFRSGSIYRYHDVEPELYEALLNAASKGRFFSFNIRGAYPCERIGPLTGR